MKNVPAHPKTVIYGLWCLCCLTSIRYIGQTRQGADARLREHLKNARRAGDAHVHDTPCYRWIRKHGYANIVASVLEETISVADLDEAERRWIKSLATHRKPGLNCSVGGRGPDVESPRALGAKLSNEQVAEVLEILWDGLPARVAADRFGVSLPVIYSILHFRSYRDVPRPSRDRALAQRSLHRARALPWSDERKMAMSEKFSGSGNPMYGVSLSVSDAGRLERSMRFRGEGNPASKLASDDVVFIREAYERGRTQSSLAREFGVTQSSVWRIVRGLSWGTLT